MRKNKKIEDVVFDLNQNAKITHTNLATGDPVLDEILKIRNNRKESYGDPSLSFNSIANFWENYLVSKGYSIKIEGQDVAIMMSLLKISRVATTKKKNDEHFFDSFVDSCNYLNLAYDLRKK